MNACVDHGVDFSITVARQKPIMAAVDAIEDTAWVDIAYTNSGVAQVAATMFGVHRLIVRRTKITNDPDLPALGSLTARLGCSPPTPPGSWRPPSRTT